MKGRPPLPRDPARQHLQALVTRVRTQQGHATEAEFCRAHGLSRTAFGEWLGLRRGRKLIRPSVDTIGTLARALGVSPQQVLYALDPASPGAQSPLPIPLEWASTGAPIPATAPGGVMLCRAPLPERYTHVWRAFVLGGEGLTRHQRPHPPGSRVLVRCGALEPGRVVVVQPERSAPLCAFLRPDGLLQWYDGRLATLIDSTGMTPVGTVVQCEVDLLPA